MYWKIVWQEKETCLGVTNGHGSHVMCKLTLSKWVWLRASVMGNPLPDCYI